MAALVCSNLHLVFLKLLYNFACLAFTVFILSPCMLLHSILVPTLCTYLIKNYHNSRVCSYGQYFIFTSCKPGLRSIPEQRSSSGQVVAYFEVKITWGFLILYVPCMMQNFGLSNQHHMHKNVNIADTQSPRCFDRKM